MIRCMIRPVTFKAIISAMCNLRLQIDVLYGRSEVDRLQQILFYRELGVGLERIGAIIDSPGFDRGKALREHRDKLLEKRKRLDLLIANLDKTIAMMEGGRAMTDDEKKEPI